MEQDRKEEFQLVTLICKMDKGGTFMESLNLPTVFSCTFWKKRELKRIKSRIEGLKRKRGYFVQEAEGRYGKDF